MNFLSELNPLAKEMALALLTTRKSKIPVEELTDLQLAELLANGPLSHIYMFTCVNASRFDGENHILLSDPFEKLESAGIDTSTQGRAALATGALELARACKQFQPDRPWLRDHVK